MRNSSENFSRNKIVIEGIQITYYRGGQGPVLIFLPGGGLGAMANLAIFDILAKKYDLITLDLPGFGSSETPPVIWSLEDYSRVISKFISTFGFDQIYLTGVSLGGGIAMSLAKNFNRLSKMAVVDPAGVTGPQNPFHFRYKYFFQKTLYDIAFNRDYSRQLRAIKEFTGNRIRRSKEWQRIVSTMQKCLLERLTGLEQISVPTLILWAKKDELFPVSGAETLNEILPQSKLVIVPGNHSWSIVKPKEFCDFLIEWFR